jgi:hypothetical protein
MTTGYQFIGESFLKFASQNPLGAALFIIVMLAAVLGALYWRARNPDL